MEQNIQLTDDQQKASSAFTDFLLDEEQKYMVLAGAAGTGKSTLVKHLLDSVHSRLRLYALLLGDRKTKQFEIELTATTHKAAGVLREMSGDEVVTLHSRLGLKGQNDYSTGEKRFIAGRNYDILRNKLLVVDEASMMGNELYCNLDKATMACKILLVGDHYQLAPVKEKASIMEILDCPKVYLEQVMRHGGAIAEAGAMYRNVVKNGGPFPVLVPDGKFIIHVDGPTFQKMVNDEFTRPDYTPDDARILAWSNLKVQAYNTHIRQQIGRDELLEEGENLITNKAIMYKGAVAYDTDSMVKITECGPITKRYGIEGRDVIIDNAVLAFLPNNQFQVVDYMKYLRRIKDWHTFHDINDNWLDLRPAYSSTVHKSQGSTYDRVYINLTDIGRCNISSDVARMMYVAITRASKQVILYGELPPKYRGIIQ
jgi:ATP-dependent exoDNAse (exonuclease V) alpha subunit